MKRLTLAFVSILSSVIGFAACNGNLDLGDRPDAGKADAGSPPTEQQLDPTPSEVTDANPSPDHSHPPPPSSSFTIRDAYSFDRFSPMAQRQVRGVMITTFAGACDPANANVGERVIYITFSPDVPAIPPVGTYPLSTVGDDEVSTALGQLWTVSASGCQGMGLDGQIVSGKLVITQSDESGMTGSFEGALGGTEPNVVAISGGFVAPRCPPVGGACVP